MEWRGRRLLLAAKEPGAGAVLAALADQNSPAPSSAVIASPVAAQYFVARPWPVLIADSDFDAAQARSLLEEKRPELVVVGAGAGASIEKSVLAAAQELRIEVHAVVDHFWNLWQRFADPTTAARWRYVPDLLWVPGDACRRKIVRQGAPASRVRVFEHPLFTARAPLVRLPGSAREALGLPGDACVLLFVSEWSLPRSRVWQWEGPEREEFAALLRGLLEESAGATRTIARDYRVLVKLHPSEREGWGALTEEFDPSLSLELRNVDQALLFGAANAAFGLNSMLLLEAWRAGLPTYSYHALASDSTDWLSTHHAGVRELQSRRELGAIIRDLGRLHNASTEQ